MWRADAVKIRSVCSLAEEMGYDFKVCYSFMDLFLSEWVLLAAGLVFALPMVYLRVKDHTEIEDEVMCAFPYSSTLLSLRRTD